MSGQDAPETPVQHVTCRTIECRTIECGTAGCRTVECEKALVGCILGTAIGDAMGLPGEGLTRRRLNRVYPQVDGHRFFFGRGMISDDTEHTCMVAQALIASGGSCEAFARRLSRDLRLWLMALPAGTGLATAKAVLRLCVGFAPSRSGVFSAGNGPAMRSAIIGVYCNGDLDKMRELVRASTRITHTDPKAEFGALAIALAAHMALQGTDPGTYCSALAELLGSEAGELLALVARAVESAAAGRSTESFAEEIGQGKGVSGYVYATVPVVLHAWFRHQKDYRSAVTEVIRCGGDTDTTAAILGGIIGAAAGKEGIPREWQDGLMEWPRGVWWMESLGSQLARAAAGGVVQDPIGAPLPAVLIRNVFFLLVVLTHGFRRMLPPY